MRHPSLALWFAAGCFYKPASYEIDSQPFPGTRVELACLDVAVALTDDAKAPPPVVSYTFGNRCTHATVVDLASVRVITKLADGSRVDMHPYDPKHELAALPIDGWWRGHEEIAYAPAGPPPIQVCAEVGHIEPDAAAPDRWVCMSATELAGAP